MVLFFLWGAFFVEHLTEWFKESGHLPPASVFVVQFFHLLLLIGYIAVFKWRVYGSIVIIFSALIFFGSIGAKAMLAFYVISIFPAIIFLLIHYFEKKIQPVQPEEQLPQ